MTPRRSLVRKDTIRKALSDVREMQRLLVEAYAHYFAGGDGHCKSSEGVITLEFPTYFDLREGKTEPQCYVYSYVLGPSRQHHFRSTTAALEAVREWHGIEMAFDHGGDEERPQPTLPPPEPPVDYSLLDELLDEPFDEPSSLPEHPSVDTLPSPENPK